MDTFEYIREPELKRVRYAEKESSENQFHQQFQQPRLLIDSNYTLDSTDLQVPQILDRLKNSYRLPNGSSSSELHLPPGSQFVVEGERTSQNPETYLNQDDMLESLRLANTHLKKENDKKEFLIQDLLKKLHDSLETIRMQAHQIKELQMALSTTNGMNPISGSMDFQKPPPPPDQLDDKVFKVPAPVSRPPKLESPQLELRVLQQPPSQAVYQRILRPFPTVSVVGFNSATMSNNLFVEVNLLTQSDNDPQALYQNLYKQTISSAEGDKKNLMIGGQRVQRSELGSSPDTLVVVFRKLKILSTTAQQGGAFFVLQFVLKRYVDNQFENVEGVACVISDPIEVFSHTLYLKGRPAPSPTNVNTYHKKSKKGEAKEEKSATGVAKNIVSQANSLATNNPFGQRNSLSGRNSIQLDTPNNSTKGAYPLEIRDALSSLVAASVAADAQNNSTNLTPL